jgi:hypothetical protein
MPKTEEWETTESTEKIISEVKKVNTSDYDHAERISNYKE